MHPGHMATSHPLPASAAALVESQQATVGEEISTPSALVPSPGERAEERPLTLSPQLARLPVELDAAIPIQDFRVRNLLALEPGQVIPTKWSNGDDVPLCAGDVQLAWSEFEVVDTTLAVRLTRLG